MMQRYFSLRAASALAVFALVAAIGATPASAQLYRGILAGANEVPPVDTEAYGLVSASFDDDANILTLGGSFQGLESDYLFSHIHQAPAGGIGGVIFTLTADVRMDDRSGTYDPAANTFELSPGQEGALKAGELYVNIHSEENGGGELRSQLILVDGAVSIAEFRETGSGIIEGVVSRTLGQFTWVEDGTAGIVIRQTSGAFFDEVAAGTIEAGDLIRAEGSTSTFRGLLQINGGDLTSYSVVEEGVGTPAPQMVMLADIAADPESYEAELVQVVNVTIDNVDGDAVFSAAKDYALLDSDGTTADIIIRVGNAGNTDVDGLDVLEGPISLTGPVAQFTSADPADDGYQILPIQAGDVVEYIAPTFEAYSAVLSGANEVPAVETMASGYVTIGVDDEAATPTIEVGGYFQDLESDFLFGHLHMGSAGENGPVVFTLIFDLEEDNRSGFLDPAVNRFEVTAEQKALLDAGMMYVNIHSAENGGGEIRGQAMGIEDAISIREAREEGSGAMVTVQGVVSRTLGDLTTIQDGTAGITIRQTDQDVRTFFDAVANGDIQTGSVVRITGTLSEFRGLLQFNSDNNGNNIESFSVVEMVEGPLAETVTVNDIIFDGENYESELVRLVNVMFRVEPDASQDVFDAAENYVVLDSDGNDTDLAFRVGNAGNTDIDGLPIPMGAVTVTGAVGQFTFDDPADTGYQILPVDITDVEAFAGAFVQIIHNSPDPAASVVDVFVDVIGDGAPSTFYNDVAFRSATPFIGLPSNTMIRVSIAPGASDDEAQAIFSEMYELEDDQSVILVAQGVLDPSMFSTAANAAIGFELLVIDGKMMADDSGMVEVNVVHGSPDVGPVTVSVDADPSPVVVVSDLAYGNASGYAALAPGVARLFVEADALAEMAVFDADLSTLGGAAVTALASGFLDPSMNQNGEALGLLVVGPNGTVGVLNPGFPSSSEQNGAAQPFALGGVFPNPSAQAARVQVTLPAAADVDLVIYDVLGREVSRIEATLSAGQQALPVAVSTLAPGAYVYRVEAAEATGTVHTATGRMTVVR